MNAALPRAFNLALLAIMFLWLGRFHFSLISFPHPLDWREGAMMQSTRALAEGRDPCALERQPVECNGYGLVYPLTALPLALASGQDGLLLHRSLSGAFILLTCLLLWLLLLREALAPLEAGWLAVTAYASLLFFSTPLVRPDAEGLFFFLASLALARSFSSRPWAWALAGLLAALAALTKLYFGFALLLIALMRPGATLGRAAALCWLLSGFTAAMGPALAMMLASGGSCFESSILSNLLAPAARNWGWVWRQCRRFAVDFAPLSLSLVAWAALKQRAGFWHLAFAAAAAVFCLSLGGHSGTYTVYLIQLGGPLLLLALASGYRGSPAPSWLAWALAGQLAWIVWRLPMELPRENFRLNKAWFVLEAEASKSKRLFAPADMAAWQLARGRELQDAGHRDSFYQAPLQPPKWLSLFPGSIRVSERAAEHRRDEDARILGGYYDRIFIERDDESRRWLLQGRYEPLGEVFLPYPQIGAARVIEVYVPLKTRKHHAQ